MPGVRNTGKKCEMCGRAVCRWMDSHDRRHGHADGLDIFCTPTCAMAFAVGAYLAGCRVKHKRRYQIQQMREPMIALSLHGTMRFEDPMPEPKAVEVARDLFNKP